MLFYRFPQVYGIDFENADMSIVVCDGRELRRAANALVDLRVIWRRNARPNVIDGGFGNARPSFCQDLVG
jgi:hypothetical protein